MSLWPTLLTLAIRAPSPHNLQPWRVRVIAFGTGPFAGADDRIKRKFIADA